MAAPDACAGHPGLPAQDEDVSGDGGDAEGSGNESHESSHSPAPELLHGLDLQEPSQASTPEAREHRLGASAVDEEGHGELRLGASAVDEEGHGERAASAASSIGTREVGSRLPHRSRSLPPIQEEESFCELPPEIADAETLLSAISDEAAAAVSDSAGPGGPDDAGGGASCHALAARRALRLCSELAEVMTKFALRLEALESKLPTCFRETVKLAHLVEALMSDGVEREQRQLGRISGMIQEELKEEKAARDRDLVDLREHCAVAEFQSARTQQQASTQFEVMARELKDLRSIVAMVVDAPVPVATSMRFEIPKPREPPKPENVNTWMSGVQWLEKKMSLPYIRSNCWSEPSQDPSFRGAFSTAEYEHTDTDAPRATRPCRSTIARGSPHIGDPGNVAPEYEETE